MKDNSQFLDTLYRKYLLHIRLPAAHFFCLRVSINEKQAIKKIKHVREKVAHNTSQLLRSQKPGVRFLKVPFNSFRFSMFRSKIIV